MPIASGIGCLNSIPAAAAERSCRPDTLGLRATPPQYSSSREEDALIFAFVYLTGIGTNVDNVRGIDSHVAKIVVAMKDRGSKAAMKDRGCDENGRQAKKGRHDNNKQSSLGLLGILCYEPEAWTVTQESLVSFLWQ